MPITVSLLEPQIIHQQWVGHITIEDLQKVTSDIAALMQQHGYTHETPLVSIIDGADGKTLEMNIRMLTEIAHHEAREVGIYIINPPYIGRVLVKIVGVVVQNKELRVCTGMQQALQFARLQLEAVARA